MPDVDGVSYYPQTVPGNSVVGRLSTVPGPTEAIPIPTFAEALHLIVGSGADITSYQQGAAGSVPRTVGKKLRETVSVLDFGAVGDGLTNDALAIQNAINAVSSAGGGCVLLPPTGHAYIINSGLSIPNGVWLKGNKAWTYPGSTAPLSTWTNFGSWIVCTSTTTPVVTLSGHGTGVEGIAFGYSQPVPGASYSPNTYPYAIVVQASFATIRDCFIFAATHGIQFNYPTGNGGGTNNLVERVLIDACMVGLQTINVNDVMRLYDIDVRPIYYNSNTVVQNFHEANKIGWDCYYTDNPQVDGFQVFEASIGIKTTDGTCLGSTHGLWHGQLDNVQLNFCNNAIAVAASTTHTSMNIDGLQSQSDTGAFGTGPQSGTLLLLNSDNVTFTAVNVELLAGGSIMSIGGGTAGAVSVSGFKVDSYSSVALGQTGIVVNAGATINLDGYSIPQVAGNGARFAGANSANGVTTSAAMVRDFYATFGASTFTASGAFVDISTGRLETPASIGITQARIVGNVDVTAAAGTSMTLQMGGNTAVSAGSIPTNSTGYKSFDSGWVDILTSASSTPLGRLQANIPVGATVSNGEMQLQMR